MQAAWDEHIKIVNYKHDIHQLKECIEKFPQESGPTIDHLTARIAGLISTFIDEERIPFESDPRIAQAILMEYVVMTTSKMDIDNIKQVNAFKDGARSTLIYLEECLPYVDEDNLL